MTSKIHSAKEAYVWMWLPKQTEPRVVGKMELSEGKYHFAYAKSYRAYSEAIPLAPFELPVKAGTFSPTGLHEMPGCLRDAAPDAWGRRLIDYQYPHLLPNELDYLLLSGSDRIGALDFQRSPTEYIPRDAEPITLSAIETLAKMVELHEPVSPKLLPILLHGTSVGGARPKCLVELNGKSYIAKFSVSSDQHNFVKSEYVAMKLAGKVGLSVAPVIFKKIGHRDVLLVERFDRFFENLQGYKRQILSALSLLGLHEMEARYASYVDMADLIRQYFTDPTKTLREWFTRLVFNVLIGNTDDHARNHAAFWNGQQLSLTPAYDLSPQWRIGEEATQAMNIGGVQGNAATLVNVLSIHAAFLLTREEAIALIQHQMDIIQTHWKDVCLEAEMSTNENTRLWKKIVHSEYALRGFD